MSEKANAGPMAVGTGAVASKSVALPIYRTFTETATAPEYAANLIAARFRVPMPTARVVTALAGLGGATC